MANVRVSASPATLSRTNLPVHLVPRRWSAHAFEQALTWLERARQRRQLRELGDHMLKDIGLSRADVDGEASKPFWRG